MSQKLIVVGAAGRMGKRIIALSVENAEFDIIAAIERKDHPDIGKDAGTSAGTQPVGVKIGSDYPANADAVIEFALPESADTTIDYCIENKTALVLCTTGLSENQQQKLRAAAEQIPIIYATNMSIGMNVLFSLVGKAAEMLGDEYDIEIIEHHHRFKKDAPSGSALTLAENICKSTGKKLSDCITYGRQGKDTLRQKGKIGIHAVRAGDIVGFHSVMYSCLGETIALNHNAHSRDGFARGALRAAKWLITKEPGLYSMVDVLGL